ncbi:MAG: helix-turn-helix transcriptional regulator [Acidisphaera sp.]|nr:helix-turn-helix transcriptional regulator [Acidisphaera sp.]
MDKPAGQLELTIGSRLESRRRLIDLSIEQMARHLDIDPATLRSYEQGLSRISPALLVRVAELLEAPISYFFHPPNEVGRHAGSLEQRATAESS